MDHDHHEGESGHVRSWELVNAGLGRVDPEVVWALLQRTQLESGPPGLEHDVDRYVDLFSRSYEDRLRMTLARAAGISYSEAMERWGDPEDLAAELAWEAIHAADAMERHPPCGVKPSEVLDPETFRPIDNPTVKLEKSGCWVCERLAALRAELSEDERAKGVDWFVKPRRPGEPFIVN